MGGLRRGVRNVYRSGTRAAAVVLVLGLTVAVFLTMTQATAGIGEQTRRLGAEVQTLIEVRAAGATGMGVGQDALPRQFFAEARGIPNVAAVEPYLYQRVIDRAQPAPISIVVGVEPGDALRVASHGEVGDPTVVAGRKLIAIDAGQSVAVVGQRFAETYGLQVGSEFVIPAERVLVQDRPDPNVAVEDLTLEVVGIFDSGFAFGDNQIFVPLDVAQRAFAQEERITHIFVSVASVERVEQVERDLREAFGADADVISGQDIAQLFAQTLGAIQANSLLGALMAFGVGALVVLFTMALVTRDRRREIGTLKAVGASGGQVAWQFAAEAGALALAGVLVGLLLYVIGGSALAGLLLGATSVGQGALTFVGGEDPLSALGLRFGLSPLAVAAALAAVLVLGVLGSLYPVIRAARTSPAEALRYER